MKNANDKSYMLPAVFKIVPRIGSKTSPIP